MRFIKMLGVAVAAALAVMAFVVANSASAATLCESNANPCPEGEVYPSNTPVEAEKTAGAVIHTDLVNVTCATAKMKGTTLTTALGESDGGEITSLTFANCTRPFGVACGAGGGVTAVNLPYKFAVTASGGGNGTVALASGGKGPPGLEVKCGLIECTLTPSAAPVIPLTITGGNPASAKVSASLPGWKGTLCPKKLAELNAEYEVTTPKLFIESEVAPPALCSLNVAPCSAPETYPIGTAIEAELEAESKFVFVYNKAKKEPVCKESTAEGETTGTGEFLAGKFKNLEFVECGTCPVTTATAPYPFDIDRTGSGNGVMSLSGISFTLECGVLEKCTYHATGVDFTLTGGAIAKLVSPKIALTRESGLLCSETATWEGVGGVEQVKYEITAPSPLFVRS
ncbi:MAG: hypothetical protein QOF13_1010 [Solirubrobacterales bacterium]|jgi:hypothetical protein|nr:hypothetical protein [Solirubrobacterales bacterium]